MNVEFQKMAGAVLFALILAVGVRLIADEAVKPRPLAQPAIAIAVPAEATAPAGAPAAAPPQSFVALVAAANPDEGKAAAKKCAACHTFEQGGPNRVGPNLHGVVGRDIAGVAGFGFSDALQAMPGVWDDKALDAFLANPRQAAPGTKMTFAGIADDKERAAIVAYLRSLSPNAPPLPAAAAAPAAQPPAAPAAAAQPAAAPVPASNDFAALVAAANADDGKAAAKKCTACHTFDQGGPNRVGPNLYGVVGRDVASMTGFAFSDALQRLPGTWDENSLGAFLAKPTQAAPGTKMAFAGIADDKERAALVAYLRSLGSGSAPAAAGAAPAPAQQAAVTAPPAPQPAAPRADGKTLAQQCLACHSIEPGQPHQVGPNLAGVVDAKVAAKPDYDYSEALRAWSGEWSPERLDAFLSDPAGTVPGTKDTFPGVEQERDRDALIEYLKTLGSARQ